MPVPRKRAAGPKLHPLEAELRALALAYPEAREEFPWGDRVVKVNKKVFVFMGTHADQSFGISLKLPHTGEMALAFEFCVPTGYGLGKSGWISATFGARERPPLDVLAAWLDESYRAIAPKKLVARLDGALAAEASAGHKPKKKRR